MGIDRPERKLTREEELLTEFLENPYNNGGATLLIPYGSMLTLIGKAYTAGARDERGRREMLKPEASPNRFDNLDLKELEPVERLG